MSIGIAIPCYFKHLEYIPSLLENIASSTVKPDQIVISCSSWVHNKIEYFNYNGIPVQIWYSSQKLNQATNRNRAASLLTTSLISFIDADDVMHPQRIEFLKQIFEDRPDISAVYHNYLRFFSRDQLEWESKQLEPLPNSLLSNADGFGLKVLTDLEDYPYHIHHAHVTIRRHVFAKFKFNEDWAFYRREDSLYGSTLILHNVPTLYLNNQLSGYFFMSLN